jgi:hypothetical protein
MIRAALAGFGISRQARMALLLAAIPVAAALRMPCVPPVHGMRSGLTGHKGLDQFPIASRSKHADMVPHVFLLHPSNDRGVYRSAALADGISGGGVRLGDPQMDRDRVNADRFFGVFVLLFFHYAYRYALAIDTAGAPRAEQMEARGFFSRSLYACLCQWIQLSVWRGWVRGE